jgi:hypothetical protein
MPSSCARRVAATLVSVASAIGAIVALSSGSSTPARERAARGADEPWRRRRRPGRTRRDHLKWPLPCLRMTGSAARDTWTTPQKLVATCDANDSTGVSSMAPRSTWPAFVDHHVQSPEAFDSALDSPSGGNRIGHVELHRQTRSPWASTRSATRSGLRAVTTMLWPAPAAAVAIWRPRPRELSVTIQTCAISSPQQVR